jgi:hypothetical protein
MQKMMLSGGNNVVMQPKTRWILEANVSLWGKTLSGGQLVD